MAVKLCFSLKFYKSNCLDLVNIPSSIMQVAMLCHIKCKPNTYLEQGWYIAALLFNLMLPAYMNCTACISRIWYTCKNVTDVFMPKVIMMSHALL